MKATKVIPGDSFDTQFEEGCTVWSRADRNGEFQGIDSDGVLCWFNLAQITAYSPVPYRRNPADAHEKVPAFGRKDAV